MSEVSIYQAPPRPRIRPAFVDTLRVALGKRDFSKGERGELHEVLSSMREQCAREGFPTKPVLDGDDDEARRLKHERLDGVARAWQERPELFSPVERELLPLLCSEACHGFRPHADHARAVPSHVVEAMRERTKPPAPDVVALAARIDGMEGKLGAILDHLQALSAPRASDALPVAAPPAEPSPQVSAEEHTPASHPMGKRHR